MCYAPDMDMTLEDLFASALVALGPPARMPRVTRDGIPTKLDEFNSQVGEYNHFVQENFGVVMPEYSFMAFSKWFHANRP